MRPLPLLVLAATPALADGEASWDTFRQKVHEACLAALEGSAPADIEVNPFGSEHYGVALIRVAYEGGTDMMACIYDKATGRAELSTPFEPME